MSYLSEKITQATYGIYMSNGRDWAEHGAVIHAIGTLQKHAAELTAVALPRSRGHLHYERDTGGERDGKTETKAVHT